MPLPPAAPIAVTVMLETPAGTVNDDTPGDVEVAVVVTSASAAPAPGPAHAGTNAQTISTAKRRSEQVIGTSFECRPLCTP